MKSDNLITVKQSGEKCPSWAVLQRITLKEAKNKERKKL
jgi:hypothetical protein